MILSRMSNAELISAAQRARRAAHDAPLARISMENVAGQPTGVRFIESNTSAWSARSREWFELMDEVDRRGLPRPVMDWDGDSRR